MLHPSKTKKLKIVSFLFKAVLIPLTKTDGKKRTFFADKNYIKSHIYIIDTLVNE